MASVTKFLALGFLYARLEVEIDLWIDLLN